MLSAILIAATAFSPSPTTRLAVSTPRCASPVAIELPFIGKVDLPELPELPGLPDFGGGEDFQLFPDDVEFTDADGDNIVLRPKLGRVDFFVNKKLRMGSCMLVVNGNTIELTGTMKKGTPLSFIGFDLEETVTEATTPRDPAALEAAAKLA